MDLARGPEGKSRSQFIREAIEKEVRRLGIAVPQGIAKAPDRARVQRYPEPAPTDSKPSSGPRQTEKEAIQKAVSDTRAETRKRRTGSGRSRKAGSTTDKTS